MFCRFLRLLAVRSAVFFVLSSSIAISAPKPSDIPIKDFAQLRTTSSLKLSPDGKYMAYFTVYKGRQLIIIKPTGNADASAVVPAGEGAELTWFEWANNNRLVFAYAITGKRGVSKTRETRLFAVDKNGENRKNLIGKRKIRHAAGKFYRLSNVQDDVIDWLNDDPDHILIAVDGDQDGKYEVRKVNVHTSHFKEIINGFRGIQNYRTDQQGVVRLGWGYELSKRYNMYKSPISNKWKSIAKTDWADKGFDLMDFTKDPKIAYAYRNNEHGRNSIYHLNLETNEILEPVFSDDKVDFDKIVNHPATGKPAGVQYTVDKPKIIYFEKKLKSIQKTIDSALKDTVNKIVSIQPDKRQYLIHASSDVEPGVYYLLDMTAKKLDFIAETMPGITPEDMSPVKAVTYKSRDGVDIPAYLTIPKGKQAKNLPTVVLVHGGPRARDNQMFDSTVQFLASRGYAVLQPNFRGSAGFGQKFANAGRHQWGGVMQDDVTDGTKWLIEQAIADPKKICIVGSSYGGYSAAMGLIKTPDLFKCGISTSAVFDIPAFITDDKKFIGGRAWTKTMGLEGQNNKTVSPYHRAKEIKAPLLIIHAEDDHRVRYRQAKKMAKKLKKLKKKVTFVTMKDGDHYLDTEASRIAKLTAMEKFLKKHIGK